MQLYYAHITHDGLKKDTSIPRNKRKVLIYVAWGIDAMDAQKQFKSLESEFGGQNFQILNYGLLSPNPSRPQFMGVELRRLIKGSLVVDWNDVLPKTERRVSDCTDCD